MPIYNYKEEIDVDGGLYPANQHLCYGYGNYIYFVDSNDLEKIKKIDITDGSISTIHEGSANYDHTAIYPTTYLTVDYLFVQSYTAGYTAIYRIRLSDDNVALYWGGGVAGVSPISTKDYAFNSALAKGVEFVTGSTVADGNVIFPIEDGTVYAGTWYDLSGSGSSLDASFAVDYGLYEHIILVNSSTNVLLLKYNLNTRTWTLMDTIATSQIPTDDNLRGISYDGSDNLFFILKDRGDSKNYLYTYNITGDVSTKNAEYNVALGLDRFTDSTADRPFNLEKGINLTDRYIYQISAKRGHLYQIADLTNIVADGTLVAITDTYLLILRDDTTVEIWKFQDMVGHITKCKIHHTERSYPWAELEYDSNNLDLLEGMFIQIIGTITLNGAKDENGVRFEGYVLIPEDRTELSVGQKRVDLLNPAYYDLKDGPTSLACSGRSDEFLTTMIGVMNYITAGTLSNGQAMGSITLLSDKDYQQYWDEIAVGDQFIWVLRPTGELDYNDGSVDSTVNYDQVSAHYCDISYRQIKLNKVIVKGGIIAGTQIVSAGANNKVEQQVRGIIPRIFTIAFLDLLALANVWDDSILAVLSNVRTDIEIRTLDDTNGMILPGNEITFDHVVKSVASQQWKITQVIFDDISGLAEYLISSSVRYDVEEFTNTISLPMTNNELMNQVNTEVGVFPEAEDVLVKFLDVPTYDNVQDWINNCQSAGYISGGEITDSGGGQIDVAAGTGFIKITNSDIGVTKFFDWDAEENLALTDDSINWIFIDYNIGTEAITVGITDDFTTIDFHTEIMIGRVYSEGGVLHIANLGQDIADFMRKSCLKDFEVFGSIRASGLVITESGNLKLDMTAGVYYCGHNRRVEVTQNTNTGGDHFDYWYRDGGGGWTKQLAETAINNTQYDDGDGGLATLLNTLRYGVHWVYLDFDGHLHVQFGQGDYKLAEAEAAHIPVAPAFLQTFSLFLGRIIVKKSATSFTDISTAWETQFIPATASIHNELGGLEGGAADNYVHLTTAEQAALHAVYTDAEAVAAVEAATDVTFSSFPITPSAAPDADYEVANKKYVDDNAGGDLVDDTTPQLGGDLDLNDFEIQGNSEGILGDTGDLEIYKATYLSNPTVGLTGTNIPFVDAATLYNGELIIIAELAGHKNVLRLQDDATAAEDPEFDHIPVQATSGIEEFYIRTNDSSEQWQIRMFEGATFIERFRITGGNIEYSDTTPAWQNIQAFANDTDYHFKFVWRADNTWDLYINTIKVIDNLALENNQTSGIDKIKFLAIGDSTDYLYIDAFGQVGIDGYEEGDNKLHGKWIKLDSMKVNGQFLTKDFNDIDT